MNYTFARSSGNRSSINGSRSYQAAFEAKVDVKKVMFDFLNTAIDEVQADGDLDIDRPALLKVFHRGEMTELDRRK